MFEKEAKERARKIEENQTLGVYDNDEEYARDRGWNEGEVAGYEEGFKDGAEFSYNKANEELEKENAELKEQCSILADSNASNDFFEEEEAQTCLSYTHYIKIPFKGESPIYSTKYAAGADIVLPKDVVAKAHSIVTWIDLEVGFDIPEGFCIMLQPRSSTSRKWHVLTDTGIIDSDYKLENIHCGLVNVTDEDIKIPKGTRIVQLLILPVYHATNWKCFNNIRNSKKGSGSTGN